VLDPSNWPKECPLTYRNEEIKYLCDTFHLNDTVARRGFQEYIDNVRTEGLLEPPPKIVDVIKAVKTLNVSTAKCTCERVFSQMNILASSVRLSLSMKILSTLIFIKCVGPPPEQFDPTSYARTWVTKQHCLADDLKAHPRKRNDEGQEHDYSIIWKRLKV